MPTTRGATPIVDWAVAAQRLEGWEADAAVVDALTELALESITMREYLGLCRRRFVSDEPRRLPTLARRRPYLIRGTDVLDNNLGLHSKDLLAAAEHAISAGRAVRLLSRPPAARSVTDVHRDLFADIYPWAGELRRTNISKAGVGFFAADRIASGLMRTHRDVHEAFACADGYSTTALAYRLARIYADYNQVHPFREGNGRAGMLVLQLIAMAGGRWIDVATISRREWILASRDSLNGQDAAGPAAEPLRALFERSIIS